MKQLVSIPAFVLFLHGAMAQTPPAPPSSGVLQSCLLRTPVATWVELDLSQDQLKRMQMVQQACKEECEAAGVKKVDNPVSHADGSTVMSEVKNILNTDQYRAWVAYCAGSAPDGKEK